MTHNELVLLDQAIEQRQKERSVRLPDDDAFELFACEYVLRDRELSPDEVADGVVGGGNDGGLDAIYVFLGDELLSEDSAVLQPDFEPKKVPSGSRLELWLVQAKRETSYTETALDKVADTLRRLLDLGEEEQDLLRLYASEVVARTGLFRDALRALVSRHVQVVVHFSYVTRGRTDSIHTKVAIKGRDLEKQLRGVMTGASATVEFLGPAELWTRVNTQPSYTSELTYTEGVTSGSSHVALVSLGDYMAFLTDDNGFLRRNLFDLNVRDYQGDVEVNRDIRASVESIDSPEFWWLNNGVTVVCSKATAVGKTYALDDVQIVNGLQTSHTMYDVLRDAAPDHPAWRRAVLVRILVTGDEPAIRDQVIRATNRQTSVPFASLHATDDIQRDIEAYFLHHGWFYDRRKNYYRNQGKTAERIVSIPLLAQAVMAMGLSRPDDSRARPSSLLKKDADYATIFSEKVPLSVYLWLATAQKAVDAALQADATVSTQERTNLRFHVAMVAVAKLLGTKVHSPMQVEPLAKAGRDIVEADLGACVQLVRACVGERATHTGDAPDKIAKGRELVSLLLERALRTTGGSAA